MTGTEFTYLQEGDQLILTEDINTYDFKWHKGDIVEVVYTRQDTENMYLKNLTTKYDDRPSYKTLGPLFFFKAMEKYKSWKDIKTTQFKHKFAPSDIVWYMKDNKPFKDSISQIVFTMNTDKSSWYYILSSGRILRDDEGAFATKDELIDSLR